MDRLPFPSTTALTLLAVLYSSPLDGLTQPAKPTSALTPGIGLHTTFFPDAAAHYLQGRLSYRHYTPFHSIFELGLLINPVSLDDDGGLRTISWDVRLRGGFQVSVPFLVARLEMAALIGFGIAEESFEKRGIGKGSSWYVSFAPELAISLPLSSQKGLRLSLGYSDHASYPFPNYPPGHRNWDSNLQVGISYWFLL